MKILKEKEAEIGDIIKVLEKGGLVIFPSETVYGAAVDATNIKAVHKLTQYKKRPLGKPFSIMCDSILMAEKYAELNNSARELYKKFLPGPITVISKGKHELAMGIESETGTLGIRIPDYPLLLKLIKYFGRPLTATSANASYQRRPYKIADILDNISEKQKKLIDLIIDAGELPHNEPSTVIDTTLDDVVTLRQGEIVIGHKSLVISRSEENTRNIGKELWQKYEKFAGQRAIVFALEGPMGAGKTQFTKGLGRAMGIKEEIISPTYNLELQYLTPLSPLLTSGEGKSILFNHIDAWRIQSGEELENLGLKGLINDKSVIAIEWADRVADTIRKYNEEAVVWVKIEYAKNINERKISWGVL